MYLQKEGQNIQHDEAKQNLIGYFAVLYEIKKQVDNTDMSLDGDVSVE